MADDKQEITTNGGGTAIVAANALTTALDDLNQVLQGEEEVSALEALVQESDKSEELALDLVKMDKEGEKFKRSDGDEVDTLTGIVISFQTTRGMWENPDDLTLSPFCSSIDGITGTVGADIDQDSPRMVKANDFAVPHPYATKPIEANRTLKCRTCPMNKFGSAIKGNGKACSERRRLPILEDGTRVPVILSLPPTSLTPWKEYCTKMRSEKAAFWAVKTQLYVNQEKRRGFTYGVIGLDKVGPLDEDPERNLEIARQVLKAQKAYGAILAEMDVTAEEYGAIDDDSNTIDHQPAEDRAPF